MYVFVAVAEEGGFAPAARRLNTSPPSVTRAVTELESRIRAQLFHRTTRSVQLTDIGKRYLADCRRILSETEQAERNASSVYAAPSGLVTVTASLLFGRIILSRILLDLLESYPDISVRCLFVDRVVHMLDEEVDVAVRIGELPDSSLSATRVGGVQRVLCASPDYLDEHGRPSDPHDLATHKTIDFVNMTRNGAWTFHGNGTSSTFKPCSRFLLNCADVAIDAALAGRGITRVLSYMVAAHVKAGTLETVLDDFAPPAVPVHVVHKELGQTSALVRTVVDHFVERLKKEPAIH